MADQTTVTKTTTPAPIGHLTLAVRPKVLKAGQKQITVEEMPDISSLGLPGDLGTANPIVWTIQTKDGSVEVVQADTHGIWRKHQMTPAAQSFWDKAFEAGLDGESFPVAVLAVRKYRAGSGTGSNKVRLF